MSLPGREELLGEARGKLEEKRRKALETLDKRIEEIVDRHLGELEKVKERFITNLARTTQQ